MDVNRGRKEIVCQSLYIGEERIRNIFSKHRVLGDFFKIKKIDSCKTGAKASRDQ